MVHAAMAMAACPQHEQVPEVASTLYIFLADEAYDI